MGGVFVLRKPRNGNKCRRFDRCITMRQTETELFSEETRMRTRETRRRRRSFFLDMILLFRTCSSNILFLSLLLLSSSFSSVLSENLSPRNQTLRPLDELNKLKAINQHLRKINKPSIKTIHSPDGDIIDCVLLHHQPAFDHPSLRGQKPLGETCPEGTVPIRRTKEEDILRANSVSSFGKKLRHYRRDTSSNGHEHAVGYVSGEKYYGAKASINVWAPQVQNQYEFSLSQIWIISGSFGNDLNTIEAGWQVSPELYGDNYPRFFTYWTNDAYQATGCYNLLCSGFVQTNSEIAIGAAISPSSSYKGGQFDITLLIWKDPKHGNWWLEFGSGILVGYWPSFLFTHLKEHASMVQYGGEIVNSSPFGAHTSTQMGSGHFAEEGFTKSSYFRNIQVVDWDNNLVPSPNLRVLADHPNCYDIQGGSNRAWGSYFYYGGPGKNPKCP
uniref:F20B24.18 n=1 Tax=Arabidopsis thaliana TaxID=3702 RepID=Q9SGX5_ARATH|nr:F20B24.18 [Arabidopsis thaliana]